MGIMIKGNRNLGYVAARIQVFAQQPYNSATTHNSVTTLHGSFVTTTRVRPEVDDGPAWWDPNVIVRAWVDVVGAVYDGWASVWSCWPPWPMCRHEGGVWLGDM
jgi:hypothetical protein